MKILKGVAVVVVLIVAAIGMMLLLGSRLPHEHVSTASVTLAAPQAKVWQLIDDVATQPSWRTGLVSIEPLAQRNDHPCWTEVQKHMRMPLCEDMVAAPSTRIVSIADPTLPFGGSWTYVLTPLDAGSTRLTITENGTTGPALWRFLGHYVFHEDTNILQYEADVQKALAK